MFLPSFKSQSSERNFYLSRRERSAGNGQKRMQWTSVAPDSVPGPASPTSPGRRGNPWGRSPLALLAAAVLVGSGLLAGLSLIFEIGPFKPENAYQDALLDRDVVKLSPRIHLLGQLAPSVAYAIETSAGLVLIDTGLDPDASVLLQQLKDLNLYHKPIVAILLSHVHGDHTQGARYLREKKGAKIYVGQGDSEPLRAGGPREAFFSTFSMEGHHIHATPVDVELKGGEELVFGDTKVHVIATPGHTPGSMCYLLESEGERALFGGDTISSLIADLGIYSAYLAPRYRGNARDYLQSLRKLRSLPKPDLVLPGHPNEQGQPHSPRLTEAEWHELLDRGSVELETLVARYDADGEDFLDGHPKTLLPGLHYLGDYKDRAVYVLHTGEHLFLFDAPGDDDFATFISKQLQVIGLNKRPLTAVLLTSSDARNIGGLKHTVVTFRCPVVASLNAHDAIRSVCGSDVQLMSTDDLIESNWFSVQVIPLEGCYQNEVAYFFKWEQRHVLVSGNVPSTLRRSSERDLLIALNEQPDQYEKYMVTLSVLYHFRPDMWLPSQPLNGQNANIYANQWGAILQKNLRALQASGFSTPSPRAKP